ncbi:MAG: cyclase family protein [Saprospiraceae bacterium]|nr:cyclase family protein [Saprospiraceae bacterium]
MYATIETERGSLKVDLSKPIDISIPLENGKSPVAFGAAPFRAFPYKEGDFTGALEEGSPVNFYNLHINPHGNGTHTESVLHIDRRGDSINKTLSTCHFICQLITVEPKLNESGDLVIDEQSISGCLNLNNDTKALIIRTTPNGDDKKRKNYTGANPCYFTPGVISLINKTNIDHLLVDLPSIDREQDGGALVSHKRFWNTDDNIQLHKTITEMVYVGDEIRDGTYLLNLQIISLEYDASPSKPVIYKILEE